ncbi:MAG: lipoprotein-releasing ABC transporter ATP-binding protein LolD [Gammaproteobacteria bacterium]|nr:lipoprotein-releasing ABC transporter ATP-binding protein LolD [Gammaproteobacteria bacterium]
MNDTPANAMQADEPVLSCESLGKTYSDAGNDVEVLADIGLSLSRGESAAVVGASGSGKSTLLHLLGGLDRPTTGSVRINGREMTALGDAARGQLRNREIGFVYQFHHLLPEFTAAENVAMPLLVRRESPSRALHEAEALLASVGLGHRLTHKPGELSGGERQRAAIARALITRPALLLADEPTGNLDSKNGEQVFELMMELQREHGTSLLVVTHDHQLAGRLDRMLTLEDGRLVGDTAG